VSVVLWFALYQYMLVALVALVPAHCTSSRLPLSDAYHGAITGRLARGSKCQHHGVAWPRVPKVTGALALEVGSVEPRSPIYRSRMNYRA
jgi:hypothetical protein